MSYELKNGVLHRDGAPVIALGQSYYPSFHRAKYPVPPQGDRIGVMVEDMRLLREAGFNFLRVAALGDVSLRGDEVAVETPFIDRMIGEANAQELAVSVRLQGYVMNLRGHEGYLMRNEQDQPMEKNWAAFMQSSLFHRGVMEDNRQASQALARHFDSMPGVVSYQIYNEPHYPYNGVFDYHPDTIAAYRAWERAQGLADEPPPRRRPLPGESPEPWIRWRLFNQHALSGFLNDTAAAVKQAAPDKETYTCMTAAPAENAAMSLGVSYFDNGEGMDEVGITNYICQEGADYYAAAYTIQMAECAAALQGKHAWTIEVDARTQMPGRKAHQETYTLLACGHKGIVYYEWRGDYPDKDTPLPDNCGFLYHDGRKAGHYDRSVAMLAFVNRYSTLFAAAEKARDGVALLSSDHAAAWADAWMGDSGVNLYVHQSLQAYRELTRSGVTADIVCARHLRENRLGVRVLFVPCVKKWLSAEEIAQIDAFAEAGGQVYCLKQEGGFGSTTPYGWWGWNVALRPVVSHEFRGAPETEDALEACGVCPALRASSRHLKHGLLRGDGYRLAIFTNTDPAGRDVTGAVVSLREPCRSARFLTPDGEIELPGGREIRLPAVCEGGVLWLRDR